MSNPADLLSSITTLLNNSGVPDNFYQYVKKKSLHDQFVLEDCFAYIGLYMAIMQMQELEIEVGFAEKDGSIVCCIR